MGNLHQIYQAIQMYHDTWDRYPIAIGHFTCSNGPQNPPVIYFQLAQFIKSNGVLRCPLDIAQDDSSAPLAQRNWKGPGKWLPNTAGAPYVYPPNTSGACGMMFPARESYDAQFVPDTAAGTFEVHYTLNWTETSASSTDYQGQLKYRTPAPGTVITWCMNHAAV